ncbi:hypothetical protein FBU59_002728, partial [Linderina macrospora]
MAGAHTRCMYQSVCWSTSRWTRANSFSSAVFGFAVAAVFGLRENSFRFQSLVSFQPSTTAPTAEPISTTTLVVLRWSQRYSRPIHELTTPISTDDREMPCHSDSPSLFQNDTSSLYARNSNSMWRAMAAIVIASISGLTSYTISFRLSRSISENLNTELEDANWTVACCTKLQSRNQPKMTPVRLTSNFTVCASRGMRSLISVWFVSASQCSIRAAKGFSQ